MPDDVIKPHEGDGRGEARQRLYGEVRGAALLGLIVNLALGVIKLVAGWMTGSFALISDAVNSLGDVLATLVVLFALRIAQSPPDAEHPYGHTRAEAIAATNVAMIILISAAGVAWEAVRRWTIPHEVPPLWVFAIAGGNVVIKEILYRYKTAVAARTGSAALVANAWDHRSDALCSLAVLVGLSIVRMGGPGWIWADEAAALIVAAAIFWSGVQLFRSGAGELLDEQASPEFLSAVRLAAVSVPGVRQVETLWMRKSGLEYFADIHVEVDAQLSVDEGHRIGHAMKDHLLREFRQIRDVMVHVEPFPHLHEPKPL